MARRPVAAICWENATGQREFPDAILLAQRRRQRRITESRPYLREAHDTFVSLGLQPWADRARAELRASGERTPEPSNTVRHALSPQELQIAQLAAAGLSNREIADRLFLSHRTIGSHLYRIFPKLGVTARAQLRDALPAVTDG